MPGQDRHPPSPGPPPDGGRLPPETVRWDVGPVRTRADIPGLCERLRVFLAGREAGREGTAVVCDLGAVARPDMVTVEALARLQLTARRLGWRILLDRADDRLRGLLALTGLGDVLPLRGEPIDEDR